METEYIGSQQHFEDCINNHYDQKECYEKEMNAQMEKDYYKNMEKYYEDSMRDELMSQFGSLYGSQDNQEQFFINPIRKRGINVLSLFDGMSCGQIALNRVGIEYDNYFSSEIDKHAIKVTQTNYPNTIQLGDVTEVKAENLPKIDLLIGGSPCQGFSFAGAGLNFEDERSKLFFEFVRLKNELKPKYFLLENVKMKQEFQDIISEQLGVKPILINSSLVSAQNRERLYWTNIPIENLSDKNIVISDIVGIETNNKSAEIIVTKNIYPKKGQNGNVYAINGKCKTLSAGVGITGNGIGSSNAPKIEWNNEQGWRRLTATECERLQTVPDDYTNCVSDTQRYKMLGNGWTIDVIAHIFKSLIPLPCNTK